jgi:hypothetical protein
MQEVPIHNIDLRLVARPLRRRTAALENARGTAILIVIIIYEVIREII